MYNGGHIPNHNNPYYKPNTTDDEWDGYKRDEKGNQPKSDFFLTNLMSNQYYILITNSTRIECDQMVLHIERKLYLQMN